MKIKPDIGKYVVYASSYCKLDSNVNTGGGTNETKIIQNILDKALEWGRLHFIVDGAALVCGLKVHSNTTIECLDKECGFYLADGSDDHLISNSNFSTTDFTTCNVTLKGGYYNHNGVNQSMTVPVEKIFPKRECCNNFTTAFKFFGIKNLRIEGVTLANQRRYCIFMGNWENVFIENFNMPLPILVRESNQDGIHLHSPGKNLVLKNIYGRAGDDFIALNTDEGNKTESISDVTIDGVFLDGATQGIRLLCRERGSLENVYINNIHGTVDSFGFYINPWFDSTLEMGEDKPLEDYVQKTPDFEGYSGKYKNVTIQNVNLVMKNPTYTYNQQSLFCLGGDIENLKIQNVSVSSDQPDFRLVTVREGHGRPYPQRKGLSPTKIENLTVDGIVLKGTSEDVAFNMPFAVEAISQVENLTVKNVYAKTAKTQSSFITVTEPASVGTLRLQGATIKGFKDAVEIKGKCENLKVSDIEIK